MRIPSLINPVFAKLEKSLKYKLLLVQQMISDDRLTDEVKVNLLDNWLTYGQYGLKAAYASELAAKVTNQFPNEDIGDYHSLMFNEIDTKLQTTINNIIKAADYVTIIDGIALMSIPNGFVTSQATNIVPYFFSNHGIIIYDNFMGKGIRKGTIMSQPGAVPANFTNIVIAKIQELYNENWGGNQAGIVGSDQANGTNLTVEQLVIVMQAALQG